MSFQEKAVSTVHLDGQQAESQLKELRKQAREVKKELNQMKLNKDPGIAAKQAELNKLDDDIKKVTNSTVDFDKVLRNISGASMKQLTQAKNRLSAELRKMPRDTKAAEAAWNAKNKQLVAVNAQLTTLNAQMRGVAVNQSVFSRLAGGFNKYFMMLGTLTASFAGLIMGFRAVIKVFNDFEESVANLSSLTGLTGENLEWLTQQAKDLSIATVEGGVRIKQSAKDIVDAYTLIGSKIPILLENKEALNDVTKAAIVLSESGKIPLETAATSMAAAINQFGLDASNATEIINLMAAASQKGAGDIAYIGETITKFGAAARSVGVDINDAIILVEIMAKGGLESSRAGTGLKTFLLRSAQAASEFNVEVVGLRQALENMNKAGLSTVEMTEMFGTEAFVAASILKNETKEFDRLKNAIVGTNIAYEMAATNTETNAAKLEQAKNRAQLLRIEIGEKLAPALTFSTNGFSYLLKALKLVVEFFTKNKEIIIPLTRGYLAYIVVLNLAIIKTKALAMAKGALNVVMGILIPQKAALRTASLYLALAYAQMTGNATRAAAAKKLLGLASMATPWGMIAAGVAAVVVVLATLSLRKKQATEAELAHQRVLKQVNDELGTQEIRLERLIKVVEDSTLPLQQRQDAIKEINTIMPEYNGHLDHEGKLIGHNTGLIRNYIEELKKSIIIKANEAEYTNLFQNHQKLLKDIELAKQKLKDEVEKEAKRKGSTFVPGLKITLAEGALAGLNNKLTENAEALKQIEDQITKAYSVEPILEAKKRIDEINKTLNSPNISSTDDIMALKQELISLEEFLSTPLSKLTIEIDVVKGRLNFPEILKPGEEKELREKLKELQKEKWNLENPLVKEPKGGGGGLEETAGAYQKVSKNIEELRQKLQNLVAEENYKEAMDVSEALKSLEAYKRVLDGIISHGGNVSAYVDSLDVAALAEEAEYDAKMLNNLFETVGEEGKKIRKDQEDRRSTELETQVDKYLWEMDYQDWLDYREQLRQDKKLADLKEWQSASIDIARSITDALGSIYMSGEANKLDIALRALDRQKSAVLDSEKLTAEEKAAIQEEFLEKERQLKTDAWKKEQAAKVVMSIINTALAVTEALPNIPRAVAAGIAGAAQTAVIIAQPVPQFFKGRYSVIGQDDGQTYNVPYTGPAKTGVYKQPALIAEKGEELIIDAPTYRNIKLNSPEIIQGIMAHRVPQYAKGRYEPPKSPKGDFEGSTPFRGAGGSEAAMNEAVMLFLVAVKRFDEATQKELKANISLFELRKAQQNLDTIEKQTSF